MLLGNVVHDDITLRRGGVCARDLGLHQASQETDSDPSSPFKLRNQAQSGLCRSAIADTIPNCDVFA